MAPDSTGIWINHRFQWNADNDAIAHIVITDQNIASSGNDFGIEDIFFAKLLAVTDSTELSYSVIILHS
jgi:hypothetical protein